MTSTSSVDAMSQLGPLVEDLEVVAFHPLVNPPLSRDPLGWPDYDSKLAATQLRTGVDQAVVAGHAVLGGQQCVLAVFRFDFLGGSMGQAEGELICRAIDEAVRSGRPLVSVGRSGGARIQEGTFSLFQMPMIARRLVILAAAGIPHISIVDDPTTGGVWAALIAGADVIVARAGAQVAFAGARVTRGVHADPSASTAEGKYAAGFVDVVTEDARLASTVGGYLTLLSPLTRGEPTEPPIPTLTPGQPAAPLTGWANVCAARTTTRRAAEDYLTAYFTDSRPLWGDRVGGVDAQVLCGFGRRDGRTIAYVCQRGGKVGASGFRTASRLIALANRLHLPVVTFVDTSGADNSQDAEKSGVGTAIAQLLQQVAASSVPVLSVVVGQGVSGGAISLINPDNLWMAPDSYLAVIAPEAAAAILKQDSVDVPRLASQLALSPLRLQEFQLSQGVLSA